MSRHFSGTLLVSAVGEYLLFHIVQLISRSQERKALLINSPSPSRPVSPHSNQISIPSPEPCAFSDRIALSPSVRCYHTESPGRDSSLGTAQSLLDYSNRTFDYVPILSCFHLHTIDSTPTLANNIRLSESTLYNEIKYILRQLLFTYAVEFIKRMCFNRDQIIV